MARRFFPFFAAALCLIAGPAMAQSSVSTTYSCGDMAGFEVLAWVTITGEDYSVETQMQVSGAGKLALQEGGRGIVVLTGPLVTTFGVLGAKPASGPEMIFSDERGELMICREEDR
jgi:hypothetical protein